MDELNQDPQQTQDTPAREQDQAPSPIISREQDASQDNMGYMHGNIATNAALVASVGMGAPHAGDDLRNEFVQTGQSQDWENWKKSYAEQSRQDGLNRLIDTTSKAPSGTKGTAFKQGVENLVASTAPSNLTPYIAAAKEQAINSPSAQEDLGTKNYFLNRNVTEQVSDSHKIDAALGDKAEQELYNSVQENIKKGLIDPNSVVGGIVAFGANNVPFRQQAVWQHIANIVGAPTDLEGKVALGTKKEQIRDYIRALPPEQRNQILNKFNKTIREDPAWFTKTDQLEAVDQIFNGATFAGTTTAKTYDAADAFSDNLSSILDWAIPVTMGLSALGKGFGLGLAKLAGNPAARVLNQAGSKDATQALMIQAFRNTDEKTAKATWIYNPIQVVVDGDLPKPAGVVDKHIDDIPGMAEENSRIDKLQNNIRDQVSKMNATIYSPEERVNAVQREADKIQQTWGGQIRLGMSQVELHADGTGVRYHVTLGKDDKYGFTDTHTAFLNTQDMEEKGFNNVKIFESNGDHLEEIPMDEAMGELKSIEAGTHSPTPGNFYIQYDHDYFYRPSDAVLFGMDSSLPANHFSALASYLLDPRSRLDFKEVFQRYNILYNRERALNQTLDAIYHPVLTNNNSAERRTLMAIYDHIEPWARENGKFPSIADMREMFPGVTQKQVNNLYTMKRFYDTIYDIQNMRLYKDYKSNGFLSVVSRTGETSYHGKPLSIQEAGTKMFQHTEEIPHIPTKLVSKSKGDNELILSEKLGKQEIIKVRGYKVFDPEKDGISFLTQKELEDVYGKGGKVIETELPARHTDGSHHTLILGRSDGNAFRLTELIKNPLRDIPGYYPRMYRDHHYIYEVDTKATLNGKETQTKFKDHLGNDMVRPGVGKNVAVAPTMKEAKRFVLNMQSKASEGKEYYIRQDSRMSNKDRIAADRDLMRQEGRLFFDERADSKLPRTSGGVAPVIDPVTMLGRTSRLVASQVSNEDLINHMETAWKATYMGEGKILPASKGSGDLYSSVATQLQSMIDSGNTQAARAFATLEQIRHMEGVVNTGKRAIRAKAIQFAEFMWHQLGDRPSTNYLLDHAGTVDPLMMLRTPAYTEFIAGRPIRQLFVQGSQHLFLAGLAPKYVASGKLWRDMILLRRGFSDKLAQDLLGKEVSEGSLNLRANMMGLTRQEYDKLMQIYYESGRRQGIDLHAFADELKYTSNETPATAAGEWAGRLAEGGKLVLGGPAFSKNVKNIGKRLGFDKGEAINGDATFLIAAKKYMEENGFKSILELNKDQVNELISKSEDYYMMMNKTDAFKYQNNVLSLPFQFFSFTHKTALTYLRALPEFTGLNKYGYKGFTPSEARKIIAGQLVLFGGAGLGFSEPIGDAYDKIIDKVPELQSLKGVGPIRDLVTGGLVDAGLNYIFQQISGDDNAKFNWSDFLAPGGNTITFLRNTISATLELMDPNAKKAHLASSLFGALGSVGGMYWKAVTMAANIMSQPKEVMSPLEKYTNTMDALYKGQLQGYSDATLARLYYKLGYMLDQNGLAKDVKLSLEEAVMKGLFGVRTHREVAEGRIMQDTRQELVDIKQDAVQKVRNLNSMCQEYLDGKCSEQDLYVLVHAMNAAESNVYDPNSREAMIYHREFMAEVERIGSEDRNFVSMISTKIASGSDTRGLETRLQSSGYFNTPEKQQQLNILLQTIRNQSNLADINDPQYPQYRAKEEEYIRQDYIKHKGKK